MSGAGTVGREGEECGRGCERYKGPGVGPGLAQDLDQEALPGRTWGQRSAWVCLVWDAKEKRGIS